MIPRKLTRRQLWILTKIRNGSTAWAPAGAVSVSKTAWISVPHCRRYYRVRTATLDELVYNGYLEEFGG